MARHSGIKTTLVVNKKTITSFSTDCQQAVSGLFSRLPVPFPLRDLALRCRSIVFCHARSTRFWPPSLTLHTHALRACVTTKTVQKPAKPCNANNRATNWKKTTLRLG